MDLQFAPQDMLNVNATAYDELISAKPELSSLTFLYLFQVISGPSAMNARSVANNFHEQFQGQS